MPIIIGSVDISLNHYKNKSKLPKIDENVIYDGQKGVIVEESFKGGVYYCDILFEDGTKEFDIRAPEMKYISEEELEIQNKIENF